MSRLLTVLVWVCCTSIGYGQSLSGKYAEAFDDRSIQLFPDSSYIYNGDFTCVAPFFIDHGEWGKSGDTLILYKLISSISLSDSAKVQSPNLTLTFSSSNRQLFNNYLLWLEFVNDSVSERAIDRDSIVISNVGSIKRFGFVDKDHKWTLVRTVAPGATYLYNYSIIQTGRIPVEKSFMILRNGRLREIGYKAALFNRE